MSNTWEVSPGILLINKAGSAVPPTPTSGIQCLFLNSESAGDWAVDLSQAPCALVTPWGSWGGPPSVDKMNNPWNAAAESLSHSCLLDVKAKGTDPKAPTPVHMNSVHACFPELLCPSFSPHRLVPGGCRSRRKRGRGSLKGKVLSVGLPGQRGNGRGPGLPLCRTLSPRPRTCGHPPSLGPWHPAWGQRPWDWTPTQMGHCARAWSLTSPFSLSGGPKGWGRGPRSRRGPGQHGADPASQPRATNRK